LREYDDGPIVRIGENHRTGARGTREIERHPLRRNACASADPPVKDREGTEFGRLRKAGVWSQLSALGSWVLGLRFSGSHARLLDFLYARCPRLVGLSAKSGCKFP